MSSSLEYCNGLGLADPMQTDKSVTNARTACVETDFSVEIPIGMFDSGRYIPISEKGTHGMQLDFLLCQNAQAIQPFFKYQNAESKVAQISAPEKYDYYVKNLSLTFDLIRPDDKLWAKLPSSGVYQYNTISSLHSNLVSSDQTINLRFGQSNVLSTTHSIIPAIWVNNAACDSFLLGPPLSNAQASQVSGSNQIAKVRNVSYMRSGELFPYDFLLDSEAQADIDGAKNPAPQAQIMKPALNSVSLYENQKNKFNPHTNIGLNTKNALAGSRPQPFAASPDPNSAWILGVPMDSQKQGVDFKTREYAIRIQSELRDTTSNAFYTFCRSRNVLAYSPSEVQVLE